MIEYKVLRCQTFRVDEEYLNYYGQQNWELISVEKIGSSSERRLVFKRHIEPSKDKSWWPKDE